MDLVATLLSPHNISIIEILPPLHTVDDEHLIEIVREFVMTTWIKSVQFVLV